METNDDDIDLLSVEVFAGVPIKLYLNAIRRDYRTGEAILAEGSVSGKLVTLARGSVDIQRRGALVKDRRCAIREWACATRPIPPHGV